MFWSYFWKLFKNNSLDRKHFNANPTHIMAKKQELTDTNRRTCNSAATDGTGTSAATRPCRRRRPPPRRAPPPLIRRRPRSCDAGSPRCRRPPAWIGSSS
jgi:hypothetical protein